MQVDEGEHNLMSREELENKIATFTGGRAAEELIFGTVTTGASNDIEQATKLARAMSVLLCQNLFHSTPRTAAVQL